MATVDKLTLELDADGVDKFIRSMNDAESKLKSIQDSFIKTAKEKGLMDDKLEKTKKKKDKKQKKNDKNKNSAIDKFNKNLKKGAKTLDTMLKTLLAISAVSFGLSGLMSKSELAAKTGTDLANQTRNTTVKTEDLEAAQTASEAAALSKNALDGLVAMFARNQNEYLARGGVDMDTQKLLGSLNGYDQSGKKIQTTNTDPIETIKAIATMLQSNSESNRNFLAGQMMEMGVSSEAVNLLSNPKFFDYLKRGTNLAIKNKSVTDADQRNNAEITFSDKSLQNQWDEFGRAFTPIRIKLNNLAEKILKEVNKMTPLIDEAMPKLEELCQTILDWVKKLLNWFAGKDEKGDALKDSPFQKVDKGEAISATKNVGVSNLLTKGDSWYNRNEIDLAKGMTGWDDKIKNSDSGKLKAIQEYDSMIESIENGVIKFSNGQTYSDSFWDLFKFNPYLTDHFDELLQNSPSNQELMQNSNIAPSNSQSQIININEFNVNTDENNAKAIVNNSIGDANIIRMSGSSAMSFMHNIG